MERKRYPVTFKQIEKDGDGWLFEGHASIFLIPDDGMPPDIMLPGAFSKTIKEWGPDGANRIKVLALHRYDWLPIGRPIELSEDQAGLSFKARISNTSIGSDVAKLITDQVITEMSIGYDAIKWEIDKNAGVRRLQEVKLWEISPVTWAMHPLARINALKDLFSEVCHSEDPELCAAFKKFLTDKPSAKTAIEALLAELEPATTTPADESAAAVTLDPEVLQSMHAVAEQFKTYLGRKTP